MDRMKVPLIGGLAALLTVLAISAAASLYQRHLQPQAPETARIVAARCQLGWGCSTVVRLSSGRLRWRSGYWGEVGDTLTVLPLGAVGEQWR